MNQTLKAAEPVKAPRRALKFRPRVHFDDRVSTIEPTLYVSQQAQQCPNSISELWNTLEEIQEAAERNARDPNDTTDRPGDELSVLSYDTHPSPITEYSL